MKKQLLLWSMLICIFTIGNAQINIPDANFKQALLDHTNPIIDTNGDGEISIMEALIVEKIDVGEKEISNLTGIEEFVNLTSLSADKNSLDSINLTVNTKLEFLYLDRNNLSQINISNNLDLKYLYLRYNDIVEIDIINHINLEHLYVEWNNITEIDVTNNINLTDLELDGNRDLTEIDVSNNINLRLLSIININDILDVDVTNNPLLNRLSTRVPVNSSVIDLSNNSNLSYLLITGSGSRSLSSIDLSNNINLRSLYLWSNSDLETLDLSNQNILSILDVRGSNISSIDARPCSLTRLNISANRNLETVYMTGQDINYKTVLGEEVLDITLGNSPNLRFICADQVYLNDIYSLLEDANQTDCLLSSDCDDPHNRIQGNITFDLDNDGCGDEDDVPFNETLSFNAISLTDPLNSITAYPNEEGQYTLHAEDGTYFFAPALQNINYFVINPPVSPLPTPIPLGLAGLTTDYCIQPLGDFNDLEVSVFPVSRARPGFNATYLIRYKNIGTTVQSGSVTLDYQEDVLDYVSSTPSVDSYSNGQLTWEFTDLFPMETVEIPLTFILNTPMDSPALNGGEILNYTATITGATDETPDNNLMDLAQTVVNSYDPNDKTCLEGDILDPDDVGNYLHYLIRFENEGTAEAVNIRVLDVIDTTKLDIETLVPLEGSHSYTTTITNGNEVEFTFNNINLPFDDANNDGYVLFKIKSLDTLVEGDEIVNSAAIYFDFNFPIITENSVVRVEREVVEEPSFSDYFTLSPNPTTGILNLAVLDDSIAINYMLIYDLGGNLVGYYFGTTRTMDVSYLFPNSYFMKIFTDKGELATQFIKL